MTDKQDWLPEPWELTYDERGRGWGAIHDKDGSRVIYVSHNRAQNELAIDDAPRIVACVNACAGVPTEDIADLMSLTKKIIRSLKEAHKASHKEHSFRYYSNTTGMLKIKSLKGKVEVDAP